MENGEDCTKKTQNDQSKVNPIPFQGSVNSDEKDEKKLMFHVYDKFAKEAKIPLFHEIFEMNQENIDKIFNKIQETPQSNDIITKVLEYALKIRPKQTEPIISLLSKINAVNKYHSSYLLLQEFQEKLIQKGFDKFSFHDYYESCDSEEVKLFEEGSVEEAIKEDSVNKLIKITAQHDFNPKGTLEINSDQLLYFVTEDIDKKWYEKNNIEVTYMQLMAYFGSVKCFKYALIDGSFEEKEISKYAVAGGNVEIIHLLEQKGISFDNCFEVSVKYHRDDISEWLLRNYECETIKLSKTVEYFNIRAFFYLFKTGDSNSDHSVYEALLSSVKTGNIPLIKYIFETCNESIFDDEDEVSETIYYFIVKFNNLETLKYILNSEKIPDNGLYNDYFGCEDEYDDDHRKGGNALHFAVDNSNTQMVDFLIGKGFDINSTTLGDGGGSESFCFELSGCICDITSLHIAVGKNDYHMAKYL